MSRVYFTERVPAETLKKLTDAGIGHEMWEGHEPIPKETLIKKVAGVAAIVCFVQNKIDKDVIDAAGKSLKVVCTLSVGFDHIDVKYLTEHHIPVGNTPSIPNDAVAEFAVALLLATGRRLFEGNEAVRNGGWAHWGYNFLCGRGLPGKTVGIVGMGRIGQAVARRLIPFQVKDIIYYDIMGKEGDTLDLSMGTTLSVHGSAKWVSWENVLKLSDYIICCCTLCEATKGLFNAKAFSQMRSNAIFVNVSRGQVVDQEALYTALKNNVIAGAGLDVTDPEPLPTDHKLLELKNCIIEPHIASACLDTRTAMAEFCVGSVLAGLSGKPLPAPVKL